MDSNNLTENNVSSLPQRPWISVDHSTESMTGLVIPPGVALHQLTNDMSYRTSLVKVNPPWLALTTVLRILRPTEIPHPV